MEKRCISLKIEKPDIKLDYERSGKLILLSIIESVVTAKKIDKATCKTLHPSKIYTGTLCDSYESELIMESVEYIKGKQEPERCKMTGISCFA